MADTVLADTGTSHLEARLSEGVATIVLNRPERLNALSATMADAFRRTLERVEAEGKAAAVVLTGTGRAFCAGGDVKAFAEQEPARAPATRRERLDHHRRAASLTRLIYQLNKPVIAALPGPAAGAGLALALAADLRIGCQDTVMTTAFLKVSLPGDFGTAWFLSRLIGPAAARELMLLNEKLDAPTCLRRGLLTRMVDRSQLAATAQRMARELANAPRTALQLMKQNLRDADDLSLEAALAAEAPRHLECSEGEEHRQAVRAFLDGRAASRA